jgi:hypothetical protein
MTKKDSRIGESLWYIWEGYDYTPSLENAVIYYTEDHVDLDNEIVSKALASSIQRDGVVDSLGDAFKLINAGYAVYGNIGFLDKDFIPQPCNKDGKTENGDQLNNVSDITWVEVVPF